MCVDDVALTVSPRTFRKAELILSHDISVVNTYLSSWRLRIWLRRLCAPVAARGEIGRKGCEISSLVEHTGLSPWLFL